MQRRMLPNQCVSPRHARSNVIKLHLKKHIAYVWMKRFLLDLTCCGGCTVLRISIWILEEKVAWTYPALMNKRRIKSSRSLDIVYIELEGARQSPLSFGKSLAILHYSSLARNTTQTPPSIHVLTILSRFQGHPAGVQHMSCLHARRLHSQLAA